MLGRSIPPGQGIVEGAGENARGRRLADAAHAGQDIGLVDAAGGEGIGERAHHRLLADQVLEAHGPVFSRQHPIGLSRRRGRRLGCGEERIAQGPPLIAVKGSMSEHLSEFRFEEKPPSAREGGPAFRRAPLACAGLAKHGVMGKWEVGQRPALSR